MKTQLQNLLFIAQKVTFLRSRPPSFDYFSRMLDCCFRQHCVVVGKTSIIFVKSWNCAMTPFQKALFETHVVTILPSLVSVILELKIQYFSLLRQCFQCFHAFQGTYINFRTIIALIIIPLQSPRISIIFINNTPCFTF